MSRYNSPSLFNAAQLFPDLLSRLLCTCWETVSLLLIQPTGLSHFQISLSLSLSCSLCMIELSRPSACISSKLAGVYEIEFYKADKHRNLRREKEALIELSNPNLPRDSVWQKLIRNAACLCRRDCLTVVHLSFCPTVVGGCVRRVCSGRIPLGRHIFHLKGVV